MIGTVYKHGAALFRPHDQDYIGKLQPFEREGIGKYAKQPSKATIDTQMAVNRQPVRITLSPVGQQMLRGEFHP